MNCAKNFPPPYLVTRMPPVQQTLPQALCFTDVNAARLLFYFCNQITVDVHQFALPSFLILLKQISIQLIQLEYLNHSKCNTNETVSVCQTIKTKTLNSNANMAIHFVLHYIVLAVYTYVQFIKTKRF